MHLIHEHLENFHKPVLLSSSCKRLINLFDTEYVFNAVKMVFNNGRHKAIDLKPLHCSSYIASVKKK